MKNRKIWTPAAALTAALVLWAFVGRDAGDSHVPVRRDRAGFDRDGGHDVIRGADLTLPIGGSAGAREDNRTMSDIERDAIRTTLAEVGGNRRLAAERLRIGERTLYEKLKRYGID